MADNEALLVDRDIKDLARVIDRYVAGWRAWVDRDEDGEDGPAPILGVTLLEMASERLDMLEMTAEGRSRG